MILFGFSDQNRSLSDRWCRTHPDTDVVLATTTAELRDAVLRGDPDVIVLDAGLFPDGPREIERTLSDTPWPSAAGPLIVAALPGAFDQDSRAQAKHLLSHGVHLLVDSSQHTLDTALDVIKSLHDEHRRLRRSVALLASAFGEIAAVPFETDTNGAFAFVGPGIEALGLHADDLLGRHFSEILPASEHPFLVRDRVMSRYRGTATGRLCAPRLFDERRSGLRHTQNAPLRLINKRIGIATTAWISSWGLGDDGGRGSRGIIWMHHPGPGATDETSESCRAVGAATLLDDLASYFTAEVAAGLVSFDSTRVDTTATVAVDPVRLVQALRDLLYATAVRNVPSVVTPEFRAGGEVVLAVTGPHPFAAVPDNDPWLYAAEKSLSEIGFAYSIDTGEEKNALVIRIVSRPSTEPATGAGSSGAVILVVDDDAISRQVGTHVAGRLGFETIAAADGQEALDIMSARAVSLVLMDVNMPNVDGVEATKRIRTGACAKTRRDVPVVAVTAYADVHHRDEFLGVGFDEYVSKPVDISRLSQVVSRLVPGVPHPSPSPHEAFSSETRFSLAPMFERYQDSADILTQVLELFVTETPDRLRRIIEAAGMSPNAEAGGTAPVEFDTVSKLAHKLANTTGTLGGEEALEVARNLETAARAADTAETRRLVKKLIPPVEEMVGVVSATLGAVGDSTSSPGGAARGSD